MNKISDKTKGDKTKQNLIDAGMELFGEHGFTATGTRMIVQKAGVNISAIQYYFGGKEGLYRAVIEHIAERIGSHINPLAEEIKVEFEKGGKSRETAAVCIGKAVRGLLNMMIKSREARKWSLIVMREQAIPTPAFDILYDSVMAKAHGLLSRIIAAGACIEPDSDEACLRAHAVIGSVLGFLSAKETVFRRLGTAEYTKEHFRILDVLLPAMAVSSFNAEADGAAK
ncbi:CerR family C-terminal domain-containing protein [Geovibrio sp. ADMFC3]